MNNKFEPLSPNDVVSIDNFSQVRVVVEHPMLKVKEFESKAKTNLLGTYTDKREVKWVTDGVNCEILKPGGDWQKGKVRLKICL
ncbi:MAG TPA: hypothetical protein DCY88_10080 [Cyanobacteria bacterium UBA11372]|nr:hypothetical protein [Cyanobacteria bacterium UBA11372]